MKRKVAIPNMEVLISKLCAEITKSNVQIWMSKVDPDYAYGQAKISKEASKHCSFSIIGADFTGHYRLKKGFYELPDIPIVFQDYMDKVLDFKAPVWFKDIMFVTNGSA